MLAQPGARLAESGAAALDQRPEATRVVEDGDQAADADTLDGLDSTDFLGATAKAADSDKLDGIDSTGFV